MRFKSDDIKEQMRRTPWKLREIAKVMDEEARAKFGKELTITRVLDPVDGESGVHKDNRAFDARIEVRDGEGKVIARAFTEDEVKHLVEFINTKYPRKDTKLVALAHSFKGGPLHFHVQIPFAWAVKTGEIVE